MASGTFKAGPLPIGEGGTGSSTWKDAASAINFLSGTVLDGPDINLDTVILPVVRARTNSSTNASLYNAIRSNFAYVMQIFYSANPDDKESTSTRLQIAFPYRGSDNKMAWRTYANGWSAWHVITAS